MKTCTSNADIKHTSPAASHCAGQSFALQSKWEVSNANDSYEHEADAVANKVMRMPEQNFIQRKCAACEKEEEGKVHRKAELMAHLQPKSNGGTVVNDAVANGIQSSKGKGSSLDGNTLSFMSSRFGHDFSNVKIHTDSEAVQMSKNLNAKAFTTGSDIYFNEGQYQPNSSPGKYLLAHELTHVVQQGVHTQRMVQRACHDASNPTKDMAACAEGATDVGRQPQGQPNAIDARAEAIINTASGSGSNADKAMQVVNDIICSYMPTQASKVRKLNYFATEPGLYTQSVGSGSGARGDICVGDSFLNGTTRSGIARRVLQVAHELEHIEQYRTGLSGHNNRFLREFLAFYHEALADEFTGTRRMPDAMRRDLIDAALRNYNCLSDALKTTHQSKQQELLTRRQSVNGTSGNTPTNPPTTCTS